MFWVIRHRGEMLAVDAKFRHVITFIDSGELPAREL
jgi:hypothetical protein